MGRLHDRKISRLFHNYHHTEKWLRRSYPSRGKMNHLLSVNSGAEGDSDNISLTEITPASTYSPTELSGHSSYNNSILSQFNNNPDALIFDKTLPGLTQGKRLTATGAMLNIQAEEIKSRSPRLSLDVPLPVNYQQPTTTVFNNTLLASSNRNRYSSGTGTDRSHAQVPMENWPRSYQPPESTTGGAKGKLGKPLSYNNNRWSKTSADSKASDASQFYYHRHLTYLHPVKEEKPGKDIGRMPKITATVAVDGGKREKDSYANISQPTTTSKSSAGNRNDEKRKKKGGKGCFSTLSGSESGSSVGSHNKKPETQDGPASNASKLASGTSPISGTSSKTEKPRPVTPRSPGRTPSTSTKPIPSAPSQNPSTSTKPIPSAPSQNPSTSTKPIPSAPLQNPSTSTKSIPSAPATSQNPSTRVKFSPGAYSSSGTPTMKLMKSGGPSSNRPPTAQLAKGASCGGEDRKGSSGGAQGSKQSGSNNGKDNANKESNKPSKPGGGGGGQSNSKQDGSRNSSSDTDSKSSGAKSSDDSDSTATAEAKAKAVPTSVNAVVNTKQDYHDDGDQVNVPPVGSERYGSPWPGIPIVDKNSEYAQKGINVDVSQQYIPRDGGQVNQNIMEKSQPRKKDKTPRANSAGAKDEGYELKKNRSSTLDVTINDKHHGSSIIYADGGGGARQGMGEQGRQGQAAPEYPYYDNFPPYGAGQAPINNRFEDRPSNVNVFVRQNGNGNPNEYNDGSRNYGYGPPNRDPYNNGLNNGYNPNGYNPYGNGYNSNYGDGYNPNDNGYNPNGNGYNPNGNGYNPNGNGYNPNGYNNNGGDDNGQCACACPCPCPIPIPIPWPIPPQCPPPPPPPPPPCCCPKKKRKKKKKKKDCDKQWDMMSMYGMYTLFQQMFTSWQNQMSEQYERSRPKQPPQQYAVVMTNQSQLSSMMGGGCNNPLIMMPPCGGVCAAGCATDSGPNPLFEVTGVEIRGDKNDKPE